MKNTILILLFIIFAVSIYLIADRLFDQTPDSKEPKIVDGLQYSSFPGDGIYLVLFDGPIELYYSGGTPEKNFGETSQANNLKLAINGSYFREDYSHAGLLIQDGVQKTLLATSDFQVTHVMAMIDDNISILPASDFPIEEYTLPGINAIQTGPLIINGNIIESELIANSLNGRQRYLRSLIGYTQSGWKFFIITKKTYRLQDLAEKIINLELFKNEIITVVNLDGGSSTAMHSIHYENFNYNVNKNLPVILGVKNEPI